MSEYKFISRQILFDDPRAKAIVDTLEYEGQQLNYFYMASPIEAVATVGITAAGEILLTRQYRHPVRQVIYDLPAGRLHPGEEAIAGAQREFEEETGFSPQHIEPLGRFNQFPGGLYAFTNLFFARDLLPTRQNLDEGEILTVEAKPVGEVLRMILKGEVIDGSLQLGVLLALQKGLIQAR